MALTSILDWALMWSSVLAITGVCLLSWGYRASLLSPDPATKHFAWSMALLATSIFWRRFAWDIWHPIVTGEIDQRPMNILFNVVAIAAAYVGLRARYLLIPREERHSWRWWSAAFHPGLLRFRADR